MCLVSTSILDTKGGRKLPDSRQRIAKEAESLGLKVIRLTYSRPVALLMGDYDGGWLIVTDQGDAGALNVDGLIKEMRDLFGGEPNDNSRPSLPPPAEAGGFQSRGLR